MANATRGLSDWLNNLTSPSSPTLDEEVAPRPRSETEGRIRAMRESVVGANEKGVKAVLCGDLGGTNSRLVLFEVESLTDSGGASLASSRGSRRPARAARLAPLVRGELPVAPGRGRGRRARGGAGAELPLRRQLMLRVVGKQFPLFTHLRQERAVRLLLDVVHEFGRVGARRARDRRAARGRGAGRERHGQLHEPRRLDDRRARARVCVPPGSSGFVNDFVANGFGTVTLREGEYEDLGADHAAPVPGADRVRRRGHGLGEAFATASRASAALYEAWPSEGGHASRAAQPAAVRAAHGAARSRRARLDRTHLSGKGIVNVYEFLASVRPNEVDEALDQRIRADDEGAAHVGAAAFDNKLCHDAMEIMMETYGAECGNAAIKFMPFGGLYIAGGIAMKNRAFLNEPDSPFQRAYRDRGRVSPLLRKVPLRLVTVEDLGLRGAHYVALTEYLGLSKNGAAEPELAPAPAAPEHDEALIEVVKGIIRALYVGSACIAAAVVISNRRK